MSYIVLVKCGVQKSNCHWRKIESFFLAAHDIERVSGMCYVLMGVFISYL
jgi:hypothetical protein